MKRTKIKKDRFETDPFLQVKVLQTELSRRVGQFGGGHNLEGKEKCGLKKELSEEIMMKTKQRTKGAMSKMLQERAIKNSYLQKQRELREKVVEMEEQRKEQVGVCVCVCVCVYVCVCLCVWLWVMCFFVAFRFISVFCACYFCSLL